MNQSNENNQGADLSSMYEVPNNDTKTKGQQTRPTQSSHYKTPWMIRLVIKLSGGYVKNESQAGYVILGFVAVMIIVSLFLIFGGGNKPDTFAPPADAPPAEIIPPA